MICCYKFVYVPKEKIVIDLNKEYNEYLSLVYSEEVENTFEDKLKDYIEIKYPLINTRFNKTIKLTISYPDLYTYFNDNKDFIMNDETTKEDILNICDTIDKKEIELILDSEYDNGYLILDSNCFEYKNAVSCGLYSLMLEEYEQAVNAMLQEVDE